MEVSKIKSNRWVIWIILVLCYIIAFFHRMSIGAIVESLKVEMEASPVALSYIASLNFYSYGLLQIPMGIFVDNLGPRKISSLGMLLAGVGSILFSLAPSISVVYISRIMVGVGISGILISILNIQGAWFGIRQYSTLSGLTSFLGNIGSLLATAPFALVIAHIGWRSSFMVIGVITLFLALLIIIYVKDSPKGRNTGSPKIQGKYSIWEGLLRILTNAKNWPNILIYVSLVSTMMSFTGLWGVSYVANIYRVDNSIASRYIMFITLGIITGALVLGKIASIINREKPIHILSTSTLIAIWSYMLYYQGKPPSLSLYIIMFLLGFNVISHILCFTDIRRINGQRYGGLAVGVANCGGFVGASLISTAIGKIISLYGLESTQGYYNALYLYLTLAVTAFIGAILLKQNPSTK